MHLVLSSQCSLKYDKRHSKWHHYVQPKFAKEVKPPDQQCLDFLSDIYQKQNLPNCSQFQLAVAAQSKARHNTNCHAPPYNPQKHVNHPQQPYHTRGISSHIVMLLINEKGSKVVMDHHPITTPTIIPFSLSITTIYISLWPISHFIVFILIHENLVWRTLFHTLLFQSEFHI